MKENDIEMRAMLAQWDGLKTDWRLTPPEEAALLGADGLSGPLDEVDSWRSGDAEIRARLLLSLAPELRAAFGDDRRVRQWLRRPLPSISDCSPIAVLSTSPNWMRWLRDVLQDIRK